MISRIYIAGAGGMLGEAFYRVLNDKYSIKYSDINLSSPWLDYLDFRDATSYKKAVKEFAPDLICHIGAHTSLEYCELNPDDAYLTNTISVETAVSIANDLQIPILYISTTGILRIHSGYMQDLNIWVKDL
jgi:dTDP-4-dehydrorhamnose reductase